MRVVYILVSCPAIFFSLNGDQSTEIIAYISGSVTFVLLIVVLAYQSSARSISAYRLVQMPFTGALVIKRIF